MDKDLTKPIAEYFRAKSEVIAVYLFGSQASGKQRSFSDVDLAILFEHRADHELRLLRNEHMVALSRLLRKDVHPVILNSAGEVLAKQVLSKGKCIINNKPKILSKFKMVMYAKICDFGYYHNSMQKGFILKKIGEPQVGG